MPTKTGEAVWNGSLIDGSGTVKSQSGTVNGKYSWKMRAEDSPGTNPEELIATAHAGCFSMALSHMLSGAGHVPTSISTKAEVNFEKGADGFSITKIVLKTEGKVPGISEVEFKQFAEKAKVGCPVSKALASVPIELQAKFIR